MTTIESPFTLPNGQVLKNRIVKSAMSEQLGDAENAPSSGLQTLYRTWAEGGTGLLITGNVMVDTRARTERRNVVAEDAQHLDKLRGWATAARENGARVWMQINHPGRQTPKVVTRRPVAPSAVALKGFAGLFAAPRALTEPEILDVIERFGRTAAVAEQAGFDGVQIHGAHGYLISQFLSPLSNQRDDRWGGSIEGRMAFLLGVVRAVRNAVSEDFAVGLKLNSADFQRGGLSQEDSMRVVEALNEERLDLLEISGGTYERTEMWRSKNAQAASSTQAREAYFFDYAEAVRARARMPLLLTGGMRSRAFMDRALDSGAIDLVGIARPLAVEPDLSRRLLAGSSSQALEINLASGMKMVDAIVESTWYGLQIGRMARGQAPDPRLSRWRAFFSGLFKNLPVRRSEADQLVDRKQETVAAGSR